MQNFMRANSFGILRHVHPNTQFQPVITQAQLTNLTPLLGKANYPVLKTEI